LYRYSEVLRACTPFEPALWLDPDGERESERESRVAVVRLAEPDWIVVIFRGTTPSPLRGLLRAGLDTTLHSRHFVAPRFRVR
jgi:hypothetical protein